MKYLALTLALLISTSPVLAESTITTVEVAKLFEGSAQFREGKKKLDEKASQFGKKVKDKREAIALLEKNIKDKGLSESSPEVESLRTEMRNLERFTRDGQEELSQEFQKLKKAVGDRVLKAVNEYAKEKKLDLVLDKGEAGRSAVLFGAPETDITAEIVKKLNG